MPKSEAVEAAHHPKEFSRQFNELRVSMEDAKNYVEQIKKRALGLVSFVKEDSPLLKRFLVEIIHLEPAKLETSDLMSRVNLFLLDELDTLVDNLFYQKCWDKLKTVQELLNFLYRSDTNDSIGTVFWESAVAHKEKVVTAVDYRHSDEEKKIKIARGSRVWEYHFLPLLASEDAPELTNKVKFLGIVDFIESLDAAAWVTPRPTVLRGETNIEMGIIATGLGFLLEQVTLESDLPGKEDLDLKIEMVLRGKEARDMLKQSRHGRKIESAMVLFQYEKTVYKVTDKLLSDVSIGVIQETSQFDRKKLEVLKNQFHETVRQEILKAQAGFLKEHPDADYDVEGYARAEVLMANIQALKEAVKNPPEPVVNADGAA